MLRIKNVVKYFGGIKAINHCSLIVKQGTITGLIGPNGAGKTTLFNLITGFVQVDKGEVWLNNDNLTGLPPHKIFRKSLSRTFQIPRELEQLTVLENLMIVPPKQYGENIFNVWFRHHYVSKQEKEIMHKALNVLEFLDLIKLRNEYAKNLSTGQKKLLEFARTLMIDPLMILLDEPGAGVNRTLMKKMTTYIRTLQERGKTFFIIEHDMDLIMNLCDRIWVMSKGKELAEGTPEEIKKNEVVLEAYLGG